MPLTKEKKQEILKNFGQHEKDTGSVEIRVALLTQRIKDLTSHFRKNPQDHLSRQGLLKMVGKRRKLLNYIANRDIEKYRELIKQLGIRR